MYQICLFIICAQQRFGKIFCIKLFKSGYTASEPKFKEVIIMNTNKCIECTVKSCAHHAQNANYCSLDKILVGTHEGNPTQDQCTDCMSFRKK